jgi:hypothetical protein
LHAERGGPFPLISTGAWPCRSGEGNGTPSGFVMPDISEAFFIAPTNVALDELSDWVLAGEDSTKNKKTKVVWGLLHELVTSELACP